ncbi:hypothetical protein [Ktedonospora formicarum]|uniref:Uncharacterized protein n=1 Tax=Ktedonospora formicarum TaxID=2778364 RepID=A0A8J3I757_9CHLR|nr:hypothetical protein [Ktedonospora formicarum]GHO47287.1 hypothetical protein KSX_54500 [Ktedonospora formicarum]
MSEPLRWSDQVSEAEPITNRLRHGSSTVASLVPPIFGAYARPLHPIDIGTAVDRTYIRWRQFLPPDAPVFDRRVQFAHLMEGTGADFVGQPPNGLLPIGDAQTLIQVLARFTTTPAQYWFCLWDGFGWPNTVPLSRTPTTSLTRGSSAVGIIELSLAALSAKFRQEI